MGLISYYDGSSLADYCRNNDLTSEAYRLPHVNIMQGPAEDLVSDSNTNGAYHFDQAYTDLIKASPSPAPALHLTLAFFLKSSVSTDSRTVFSYASDFKEDLFSVELLGRSTFRLRLVGKSLDISLASATIDWNQWSHFAFSMDLEFREMKLYLNGNLFTTKNLRHYSSFDLRTTSTAGGVNVFSLGSRQKNAAWVNGTAAYEGYLDEIALYNRVLNETEVAALYNNVGKPIFDLTASPHLRWCFNAHERSDVLGAACSGRGKCITYDTCSCQEGALGYKCHNELQISEYSSCPVNIISWWRAEGNTIDTCGRNNPEGWTNIRYSEGKVGLAFDSNDRSIVDSIMYINPLINGLPLSAFTLSFWAKKTLGDTGIRYLFTYYLESQHQNNLIIGFSETELTLFVHGVSTSVPFPSGIDPYDWLYITATWESTNGTMNFFLNGEVISTVPNVKAGFQMEPGGSVMILNDNDCIAGCSQDHQQFRGLLDELVLYKEALSPDQVRSLYTNDGIIFNNCFGFVEVDPNVCSNRGICEGMNRCRCTPPYIGEQCEDTHPGFIIQTFGAGDQGQNGLHYLMDYVYPGSIKRDGALLRKSISLIGCGWAHCIVATEDQFLFGFGANTNGSLGVGDDSMRSSATEVRSLRGIPIKEICGRASGTLVLARNNSLFSFGSGSALGNGQSDSSFVPVQVVMEDGTLGGRVIQSIHCGAHHHFVLTEDRTVFSWGAVGVSLRASPLGVSSHNESILPIMTALPQGTIIMVASGDYHGIALSSDNSIFAWGDSIDGQTGFGFHVHVPEQLSFFNSVSVLSIFAGGSASFVLTNATIVELWAFGNGTKGQLGTGDASSTSTPQQVDHAPLANCTVSKVVPTTDNTYILCDDGFIFSSGSMEGGALGDRSTSSRSTFAPITYNPVEHRKYDAIAGKRGGLLLREAAFCDSLISLHANTCSGHGLCVKNDVCVCQEGWHGDFCSIPYCQSISATDTKVCLGRGACISHDQCACEKGYDGENCEFFSCFAVSRLSNAVCNSHGSCVDIDSCECSQGFTGDNCTIHTCFSYWMNENGVCSGNGRCISRDVCECDQGYFGSKCDLNEDKKPIAVIRAPADVGLCDDVVLDGSRSSGSGLTYEWSIENDETAVAEHLATLSEAIVTVPSSLFVSFGSLTFVLRVTNDEGFTDDENGITQAVVNRWSVNSPVLMMESAQSWNVSRSVEISLFGRATGKNCQGTSLGDISYEWSQVSGSIQVPIFDVTSPKLIFPSFTFPAEGLFEFDLRATIAGQSTVQRVSISIVSASLKAIIAGGTSRSHNVGTPLTLDASPSHDPEQTAEAEIFTWTCMLFSQSGDPCNMTLPTRRTFVLPANSFLSSGSYRFTVSYSKGTRSSNTSIVVEISAHNIPQISLSSSMEVNQDDVLKISSTVESSSPIIQRAWGVPQGDLVISKRTVVSGTWDELITRGELSIAPNILAASTSYTLEYKVMNTQGVGYAGTVVSVRAPPLYASLLASPIIGAQFESPFTFYLHGAESNHVALLFRFEYIHSESVTLLQDFGPQNVLRNVIFAISGTILVRGYVKNSYGAVSMHEIRITVHPRSIGSDSPSSDDFALNQATSLLIRGELSTHSLFAATDILNMFGNASTVHLPSRRSLRLRILESIDSSLAPRDYFELIRRLTAVPTEIDVTLSSEFLKSLSDKACGILSPSTVSVSVAETMLAAFSQLLDASTEDSFHPFTSLSVSQIAHKCMQCLSSTMRQRQVNGELASEAYSSRFGLLIFQDTFRVIQKMTANNGFLGSAARNRVKLSAQLDSIDGVGEGTVLSVELLSMDFDFFSHAGNRRGPILDLNIYNAETQELLEVLSLRDGIILQFSGQFNVSSSIQNGKLLREDGTTRQAVARFWDDSRQVWSTHGCQTMDVQRDRISVKCNHTTKYAVFSECYENCDPESRSYIWIAFIVLGVIALWLICVMIICCTASTLCVGPLVAVNRRRIKANQKVHQKHFEAALMNAYLASVSDELLLKDDTRKEQKRGDTPKKAISIDNWMMSPVHKIKDEY